MLPITGLPGNDTLTGTAGADHINSGAGNDTIFGFAGADSLDGGIGVDMLKLTATSGDLNSAGNSQLMGIEKISGVGATGGLVIDLHRQSDGFTVTGGGFADKMIGSSGADHLLGGVGNDTLLGGAGADFLSGGLGNDRLGGGTGNDTVFGGAGSDVLSGGAGADQLRGDAGNDTLLGGSGNDRFIYNPVHYGRDLIRDFGDTAGNQDVIQFSIAVYADFADVQAHMHQVGANVVIGTLGGADTITLRNTLLSSLDSHDFMFV